MTSQGEWTRVVVLAPPAPASTGAAADGASALSAELRALFAARDWFAIEQHDPYLALTELCLRERAQVARAAWGLQRMEQIALVILHPQRWPGALADELAQAVRRCLPDATVYAGDDAQVAPYPQTIAAAPSAGFNAPVADASAVRPARSAPPDMPPRRHTVHDLDDAAGVTSAPAKDSLRDDDGAPKPTADRITRDEVDMLLREDADDLPAGAPADGAREQRR